MRRQIASSMLVIAALTGSTILAGCQTSQERAQRKPNSQNVDRTQTRDDSTQMRGDSTQQRDDSTQMRDDSTQQRGDTAQTRDDSAQMRDDSSQARAEAPAPTSRAAEPARVAEPVRVSGWPTMSGGGMNWTNLAYPTGNPRTSALGIEKGMPRQVRLNQEFEYVIVATNLGDAELNDVVVTDMADNTLSIMSSAPAGQASGGSYMWNLGTLGPRQSKTIRVRARATAQGTAGSCATASYNSALCNTVPVVAPSLRLTKTGPAEVLACEDIVYNFEVANTGTGSISNVVINDPLPNGLSAGGSNNLTINVGTLGAGETKTVSRTVKASRTGRFENRATATGDGLSANSGTVATVVRAPNLRITKDCVDKTFVGKEIEYAIAVTNTGDGPARNTVIEDMMPAGVSFVSASNGGAVSGGKIVWNAGTLAPNQTMRVTARVRADNQGTFENRATARAFCVDGPVADSCTTVVTGIPAILLEVIDIEDPVRVGNNETYEITVTNQGSAPDTNIAIVVTLEPTQTFVSAGGATQGQLRGNQVIFEPIRSLASKQKATFRLVVRAASQGDVRLTVVMNSDQLTRPVQETESTNQYE